MSSHYDVVVIGAGHAGIEAALAAARLGKHTLVVTTRVDRIGYMSCNPSIGGLAKGHIVREVDILGGAMGRVADKTCIQFKRLNAKKGPAVRGSRVQCDKYLYCVEMGEVLYSSSNLSTLESEVKSLVLKNGVCKGVVLVDGSEVTAKAVIITTGTFMRGVMHIGDQRIEGGRVGDQATIGISDQLLEFGFEVMRLKTGTPPRLDKNSIDWSKTKPEYGDPQFLPFSYRSSKKLRLKQVPCFITYTNERTHEIIRNNLHVSPMFSGQIEGLGPRYCPSIEDKITRFSDKLSHQTFLEPEGLETDLIYLQGISTSLPQEIQQQFLQTIPGLENVKIVRPGYAVEYDCILPTQLKLSLETRTIENLFLAGQINGTSGYEEAAGQGLIAGVNASRKIDNIDPLILGRDQSYIGVLIDDLVTKGTKEPYRMFTSRAEHRLVLREDNTIERLFDLSSAYGLLDPQYKAVLGGILEARAKLRKELESKKISPTAETLENLEKIGTKPILKQTSLADLLRRTEITFDSLSIFGIDTNIGEELSEPVEINIRYEGYIKKQNDLIEVARKMESMRIPEDLPYADIRGLSNEEIEKLTKIKPISIGQAQRVSGVNPSAIQSILVYLKLHKENKIPRATR